MDINTLEEFFHTYTQSEHWHLAHPHQLSPFYNKLTLENYLGQECYYFDFSNTLKDENITVIKESRFTTIPPHHHKDMEINYVYEGTCTFLINNKEITLNKGDLCILNPDVIHSATSYKCENDIIINIVFKKDFFNSVFLSRLSNKGIISKFLFNSISRNQRKDKYLIFHTTNNLKFHTVMQLLLCEYFDPSSCYPELIQTYVTAMFLELINSIYDPDTLINNENSSYDRIIKYLNYIEINYKNCSLEDLAYEFGYNPNYISNILKDNIGYSFSELKSLQQITEAAFLLANSDKSINDIIYKVGCSNINYFYKKFKKVFHMTPKEYRLSIKK
ncbi:helix-turn-helix domain-containing protein [Clostridium tertium]|uniref:Melibiose operon regulatory protein n=1 Tax=Clostridium tertium TaxID=1559 RepID=A0A6N3G3D4_9CLOT